MKKCSRMAIPFSEWLTSILKLCYRFVVFFLFGYWKLKTSKSEMNLLFYYISKVKKWGSQLHSSFHLKWNTFIIIKESACFWATCNIFMIRAFIKYFGASHIHFKATNTMICDCHHSKAIKLKTQIFIHCAPIQVLSPTATDPQNKKNHSEHFKA